MVPSKKNLQVAMIMQWLSSTDPKWKNIFINLPVDVFERIMKHLSLNDYVGLRAICRSFRKTVSHAIENKCCCHLPELPILSTKRVSTVKGWFRRNNKSLLRSTDECLGSVDGWLM